MATANGAPTKSASEHVERPWLVLVAPAIFLMLWSGGYAVAKIALEHVEPMTLLSLRFGAALLILLPLALILRPPLPSPSAIGHIVVVGFLIQCLYFGVSYLSFANGISAGAMALIVSLQPIVVSILAPLVVDERVTGWRWVGLGLGLAGAALVIISRSAVETNDPLPLLGAVVALLGMSIATLYEKRFGISAHPVASNAIQYTVGFVVLTPIALSTETYRVAWDFEFLAALGYLVIGNSLIAITLLLAMVRRGEASRVSALLFLVPPLAAAIAWITIGEKMPPIAWGGFVLAAAGVALATRKTVGLRTAPAD